MPECIAARAEPSATAAVAGCGMAEIHAFARMTLFFGVACVGNSGMYPSDTGSPSSFAKRPS